MVCCSQGPPLYTQIGDRWPLTTQISVRSSYVLRFTPFCYSAVVVFFVVEYIINCWRYFDPPVCARMCYKSEYRMEGISLVHDFD